MHNYQYIIYVKLCVDDGMVVPICWGENVCSNCISSAPSSSSTKGEETNSKC